MISANPLVSSIPSLPIDLRYKIIIPVTKKIILAKRVLTVTNLSFPKKVKFITGFLRTVNLLTFPERKTAIIKRGTTIPKTYIPPIANAPKKLVERKVKVRMPISTGAQQALVIPEKIPNVKIERGSVFVVSRPGRLGIGNLRPKKD